MTYTILADTFILSPGLTTPGSIREDNVSLFFARFLPACLFPEENRPFCIKLCILGCQDVFCFFCFFSTVTNTAKDFQRKPKGFPQKEQVFPVENPQKSLDLPHFPQSFPHIVENSLFPHPFSTETIHHHQICASITKRMDLVFYGMQFGPHRIAKYLSAKSKNRRDFSRRFFTCFT